MYNDVSRDYKECMKAPLRNRMYMAVSLGVVNQDAQGNGRFTSELTEWSNPQFPWNNKKVEAEYATYEDNFFKADGSMLFLPEEEEAQYNPNVGIVSKDILGTISIGFPYTYDIKGLTIDFGDAYPTSFKIVTDAHEYTYSNSAAVFTTTDNLGRTQRIDIVPITMVGGEQRLRVHKILMGLGLNYTNSEIQSMDIEENINAISKELSSIDFDLTIVDPDGIYDVDNDDSFINYLQTGQSVNASIGLELDNHYIEYVPIASLLLSQWNAQKDSISFKAVDKFALMDLEYEGGSIQTDSTLYDYAEVVLNYCGFTPDDYIIDDCLRDIPVVNPLPRARCKELLQIIANAGRCIVYQNRVGQIVFRANFANVIDPEDVTITSDSHAEWSNPQNVMKGSDYVYAEYTDDFFSAAGSMYFLPENGEEYLETSYVSAEIANEQGEFETVPTISLELKAGFTYYGLFVSFDGNPPQKMVIDTSYLGEHVQTKEINNPEKKAYISDTFKTFDKMVLSFPLATPNNRVLVNKISFGKLTNYRLDYNDIIGDVKGVRETKVKEIQVKIFTFVNDSKGNPQQVEDNVYYTHSLNSVGTNIKLENPLISTMKQAQSVAEWVAFYYANNVSYTAEYRGDPILNASDLVYLESKMLNNLQVEIENHKLSFDGTLSGQLEMRRAIRTEAT